jgi:DNA-binding transcriptional regulator/RsmH inhibitor MraZ
MNNWNELNSYAQTKVEKRRQEAEEWQLARLARSQMTETGMDVGSRFSLPQTLMSLLARLRAVRLLGA